MLRAEWQLGDRFEPRARVAPLLEGDVRGPRGRRGRRGRRERYAGRERVRGRQCTWDEPAGRVGGLTVRCARKRHERVWGESEGFVWIDELYLIFKQEESSVRAQSARAVGAWA